MVYRSLLSPVSTVLALKAATEIRHDDFAIDEICLLEKTEERNKIGMKLCSSSSSSSSNYVLIM